MAPKKAPNVHAAKERFCDFLMSHPNVVACGVGNKVVKGKKTKQVCIRVSVSQKLDESQLKSTDIIPKELEGVKTDVVERGVIKALVPTDKHRPAPGGVSIGHKNITAGTLGCLVEDTSGETFILSNNHVLANSNNGQVGDSIYQPGPHDGGTEADRIGSLVDFVEVNFGAGFPPIPDLPDCPFVKTAVRILNLVALVLGSRWRFKAVDTTPTSTLADTDNFVDAAIASIDSPEDVVNEILEIGTPTGSSSVTLGDSIQKSGRTTGHTQGTVDEINVTVNVQYGAGQIATFVDQVISDIPSDGGDSGSAILNNNNEVVGLLFAGSDTTTVFNNIDNVLELLDVEVKTN